VLKLQPQLSIIMKLTEVDITCRLQKDVIEFSFLLHQRFDGFDAVVFHAAAETPVA